MLVKKVIFFLSELSHPDVQAKDTGRPGGNIAGAHMSLEVRHPTTPRTHGPMCLDHHMSAPVFLPQEVILTPLSHPYILATRDVASAVIPRILLNEHPGPSTVSSFPARLPAPTFSPSWCCHPMTRPL